VIGASRCILAEMLGRTLVLLLLSAGPISAQVGAIEGTVKLPPREPSKAGSTLTYPGQPERVEPAPKTPLPAVVFVKNGSDGRTFSPPRQPPKLVQRGAMFIPEVMAVAVGTTVEFPNLDDQYHNVFSYSKPKRFDLGRYPTGESRPVTFDKPGVVKIYCEIHEHMRAWVVVCENPFFAVTDEAGKFRIENVPAGKHKLVLWRTNGRETEKEIEIVAGQAATVDFE